jgi:hypothetical protein
MPKLTNHTVELKDDGYIHLTFSVIGEAPMYTYTFGCSSFIAEEIKQCFFLHDKRKKEAAIEEIKKQIGFLQAQLAQLESKK